MSGSSDGVARRVRAHHDPMLSARAVRRVAMRYAGGADPATDRPAHVRAASGIAWVGAKVAVIQATIRSTGQPRW